MRLVSLVFFNIALLSLAAQACSTAKKKIKQHYSGEKLLQLVCQLGEQEKAVKGNIWFKARSTEFNGQFPAQVLVKNSEDLTLEVTNPFGGTEAIIRVKPQEFEVKDLGEEKEKTVRGYKYWNKVPLQWAIHLFLGKIPCPSFPSPVLTVRNLDEERLELTVLNPQSEESFRYFFHNESNIEQEEEPWPDTFIWEKKLEEEIRFSFSEPDVKTKIPRKWEAKSSQGEIQVRWRNREKI